MSIVLSCQLFERKYMALGHEGSECSVHRRLAVYRQQERWREE